MSGLYDRDVGDERDGQITDLLHAIRAGDEDASSRLLKLVYDDLRVIAAARMGKAPSVVTFEPTALVHECFVRLAGRPGVQWEDRRHFFGVASRAMRDIVVEEARRRGAMKRGGDRRQVPLGDVPAAENGQAAGELLALEEALQRLEGRDALSAEVVMLRHFGGRTLEQIAELLDLPLIKVRREWEYAKAFLYRELGRTE
jgi:RNA polymerase sigma factor (TIGR02999 family)